MTDALLIRAARREDAAANAAMKNAWMDASPWLPRCMSVHDVLLRHRDHMIPNRDVFVIGSPITGYIALDGENYITSLFCRIRGQGLGKALLDHVKGLRPDLWLWSFVDNVKACRFYEREGFVEQRRATGESDEGLDDILYHWRRM